MPSPVDVARAAEVRRRRALLGEEMTRCGLDALVVASEGNFTYLTGYQTNSWANRARPICLVSAREGPGVVVTSEAEAVRIEEDAIDVRVSPYRQPDSADGAGGVELEFMSAAAREVAAAVAAAGASRVGFELSSHFLPGLAPATLAELETGLGRDRVVDASPLLWRLRRRKSAYEIEQLRAAATVLGAAFAGFEARARVGATERELHRLFVAEAASAGADRIPYTAIVADPAGGPIGGASDRVWQRGTLLQFDAAIVVDGYWADFGRIYAAAEARAEQQDAYRMLVQRLASARAAARPGMSAGELAAAAAGDAREADEFGRVGHGIGSDLTEPPSLHAADRTQLETGMTLCVEPNGFFPGVGHLAAEEEIVLTPGGAKLISPPFPSTLAVLE